MPFRRPTLDELIQRATNDLNGRLTGTDASLRRSNTNALAKTHSGAVHGVYGYLAYLADQIIYDTANSDYLERWASIWGISRKAAEYASGPASFTGTSGAVVPAGTKLQRSDGAGYTLNGDVTLSGGSGSGTVTADVAGKDGNAVAGVSIRFVSAVEGVATSATVGSGGITGGYDRENDDDLRSRLLARIRRAPQGGAAKDYIDWALEVAGVTRAWCYPDQFGRNTVGVTFVCDNRTPSIIPDAAQVSAVQAHIDIKRPVTADVTVYAPVADSLNLTIRLTPDTVAVRAAVEAELRDLVARESYPAGTILVSHLDEAISIATGEADHVLVSPTADVTHAIGHMAVWGGITWQA